MALSSSELAAANFSALGERRAGALRVFEPKNANNICDEGARPGVSTGAADNAAGERRRRQWQCGKGKGRDKGQGRLPHRRRPRRR
eukprot:5614965-Prymnesium_polylepis.1